MLLQYREGDENLYLVIFFVKSDHLAPVLLFYPIPCPPLTFEFGKSRADRGLACETTTQSDPTFTPSLEFSPNFLFLLFNLKRAFFDINDEQIYTI
jgi:hypothetical protein